MPKDKKKHSHKAGPRTRRQKFWRWFKISIVVGGILTILTGLGIFAWIIKDIPSPTTLSSPQSFPVSTKIFDRHGELLYEIFADENRTPIKLKDLPPHVYQASISIEDKTFYSHFGFDFLGMIRAVRNTLLKQSLQGGSTITQQLVKNALLTRDRTLQRKVKEGVLTLATEALYTKDQILEMYLNHIPYGGTAYGVEAAAQMYFGKHAKDLSIAEAALLAGLPQAPSRYSPFQSDSKMAKNRQADVLRRMQEDGYITPEQEEQAKNQELVFALSRTNINAPHFVFYVKDQLIQEFGEDMVEKGGLRVRTSLDLGMQEVLQASLSAEVNKLKRANVSNGAALVTNPQTGEILSMIGSKDYFDATIDGKVNVTVEKRQPGSSFKPISLAIAFNNQMLTPASLSLDIPTCFEQLGSATYCPKNYDNSFHGPVQQRFALGNSYNIPAVKNAYLNGVGTIIDKVEEMGIHTYEDPAQYGISIGLGAGDVKMVEMAEAFGTMSNQGIHVPLVSILEVKDYEGDLLKENSIAKRKVDFDAMNDDEDIDERGDLNRALQRAPSFLVSHILQDNSARASAFGTNSKLVIKDRVVSVKTGTTNNLRDNWTIGYTPNLLAAVWVGNNDSTPMNRNLVSGVTGAAPIWNDFMTYLLRDAQKEELEKPGDIITVPVCKLSGLLPNPGAACETRTEYFWEGTEPTEMENVKKNIWIDPATGVQPPVGQPTDGIALQLQEHVVLSDQFTQDYCLDCTRAADETGKVKYEQYVIPANHDPYSFNPNGGGGTETAAPPEGQPAQ